MADFRVLIGWAIASGALLSGCSGGYFSSSSSHDGAEAGSAGTATTSGEGGSRNPGPRGGAGERQRDGGAGNSGGGEVAAGGASSSGETSATGGASTGGSETGGVNATGGETSATGGASGTGGIGAGGTSELTFSVTRVQSNTNAAQHVNGVFLLATFGATADLSESVDPEGLVVRFWLHPGWASDDYRIEYCNDNADAENPPSECHLLDGDPPVLDVEFVGGSDVDVVSANVHVSRVDGGDIEYFGTYSYEPGGRSETNDRIGIYYRGQLIWGVEP